MVYSYNEILFGHKKQNEALIPALAWMDLENFTLSERPKHEKPPMIWLHLDEISRIDNSIKTKRRWITRSGGGGNGLKTHTILTGIRFPLRVTKVFWS